MIELVWKMSKRNFQARTCDDKLDDDHEILMISQKMSANLYLYWSTEDLEKRRQGAYVGITREAW
jgi:hypothetical protein